MPENNERAVGSFKVSAVAWQKPARTSGMIFWLRAPPAASIMAASANVRIGPANPRVPKHEHGTGRHQLRGPTRRAQVLDTNEEPTHLLT